MFDEASERMRALMTAVTARKQRKEGAPIALMTVLAGSDMDDFIPTGGGACVDESTKPTLVLGERVML